MKQELTVHVEANSGDGTVLNMLSASHFGTPSVPSPMGRFMDHGCSTSIMEAFLMLSLRWLQKTPHGPIAWLSNAHYPLARTTVTGTLRLADGRQRQEPRWYWQNQVVICMPRVQTTSSLPRPMAVVISAFRSSCRKPIACTLMLTGEVCGGAVGSVTDQYERDNITVSGQR